MCVATASVLQLCCISLPMKTILASKHLTHRKREPQIYENLNTNLCKSGFGVSKSHFTSAFYESRTLDRKEVRKYIESVKREGLGTDRIRTRRPEMVTRRNCTSGKCVAIARPSARAQGVLRQAQDTRDKREATTFCFLLRARVLESSRKNVVLIRGKLSIIS